MLPAIVVDVLPASYGDCLIVTCERPQSRPWRMLVDAGTPETWPMLRERLETLPVGDRRIDLVVITHIDHDHIGGMLPFLQESALGLEVGEVWFNGLTQLPEHQCAPSRGVAEAESLAALLSGKHDGMTYPWNTRFGNTAVMTSDQGSFVELPVEDGPKITLLSPTCKRLAILRAHWQSELARFQRGESSDPPLPSTPAGVPTDLESLALAKTTNDAAHANGSSIAFLLEHRGASCLLAADAFPNVLGAALLGLARHRGLDSIPIDLFKLPHHASKGNVTSRLVQLAPANHYVVSTNGARFNHPDDVALARVITGGESGRALWFNYLNERTEPWGSDALTARYGHGVHYPESADRGLRITVPGTKEP